MLNEGFWLTYYDINLINLFVLSAGLFWRVHIAIV